MVVIGMGTGPARADTAGQLGPPGATTTTGPAPTTTVSTPRPTGPPATTHAVLSTTAAPAAGTTTSTTFPPFPPDLLALSRSVRRTPPNSTNSLIVALRPLQQLGFTAQQAAIAGFGQFPVVGPAYYTDDWLEARPGPIPALHPGIDIVAAMGTPLRAPVDGVLTYDLTDPTGYGLDGIVTAPDHTFYRMAHMSATVKGLATGSAVAQGQVIGFVGSTGNSTGPHCHFEVHPLGGAGVEPKTFLDAWLAAAVVAAPQLIKSVEAARAAPVSVAEAVPVVPSVPAAAATLGSAGRVPLHLSAQPAGAVGRIPLTIAAALAILAVLVGWLPSARRRLQERSGGSEIVESPAPPSAVAVAAAPDVAAANERLQRWRHLLLDPPLSPDPGGGVTP